MPWAAPLLWVVIVLNARGAARLLLRPYRAEQAYGFWLIGLTAVLAMLFDLGLEPFAISARPYWIWQQAKTTLAWDGVPWFNFFAWGVTAMMILPCATLWLIYK